MKKGLTELVFILDRSGSMSGLEKDTIGGFNSMIEKQKKEEGEVIVSTVLFDNQMKVVHDRVPMEQVKSLTDKDYYVGGCTALLDAMGHAIKHINQVQKSLPEEERPEKTLFIITTDGQENLSHDFTYEKIKKMVEKKQNKKNWEFLFLGANIDAIGAAADLGIKSDRAVNYHSDSIGTAVNYNALERAVSRYRKAKTREEVDECMMDCCDEISADYEARKVN